ncbi:MAG: TldD/PmbA family protein [Candidatus Fermentibacteraceae bacterium]|nr:TldD/PmbA family protein [Candidatus Fermentibacteraceae bacterium]MBN2607965.1 TldD/PmbA family protein [Candidatus Fermentibacteraceae bacterium]
MIPVDLADYTGSFSEYTELRVQENRSLNVSLVNGDVMSNSVSTVSGVSARTCSSGFWGFASSPLIDDESIRGVIAASTRNSRFLSSREKRDGSPLPSRPGSCSIDFSTGKPRLSQKDIIRFMKDIDAMIRDRYGRIASRTLSLQLLDMEKSLVTSDGSSGYTMIPRSILYVSMSTERDGEPVQLMDVHGGRGQFEDVFSGSEELGSKLEELYGQLMRKAEGVHPETGIKECILDADLAGILSHEAIGHTTEADIVRGGSVAGDYIDMQVASSLVTLVDFASEALGETCPVPVYMDDEGTVAEDAVIIEDGILRRFLHNKESAAFFRATPTGNARAYRFSDEPIIRMRNTAILPGKSKLEDMIGSVDDGYYLMKPSNGQADSTSEFMFGVVQGYEIKKGRLGRAIRDTTISGVAFDMLKTVTAVSDDMKWSCSGMCGKKQAIPVGMGGPAVKCMMNIGGK